MRALGNRLTGLLEQAAADPDQRISKAELLSAAERDLVLRQWNDTALPTEPATVPGVFAAQVANTPDAVAVLDKQTSLTYRELDDLSGRLAAVLVTKGVSTETPVLVVMKRSAQLWVALLAVLKAGGAYVPVNASWPVARIAFVASDMAPATVICDDDLTGLAGAGQPRRADRAGHGGRRRASGRNCPTRCGIPTSWRT